MTTQAEQKFLAQSYQDALNDYASTLTTPKAARWDWVVITASDQIQADAFRLQIDRRLIEGSLSPLTRYAIVPDTNGLRVGSGGATLNVLRYIGEQIGAEMVPTQKIMVCHSGGDSKRIPQYSVCGKLFAPVPRLLETGKPSTVFDEIVMLTAAIPARIDSGMLIVPSDTLILFNPVQLDLYSCDAAGLSIKTGVAQGQEHGVFVADDSNLVTMFLHKQSEMALRAAGAVDSSGHVNVDTGLIWFGTSLVRVLIGLISSDGSFSDELFQKFVNEKVCLSFYADLLFPLAAAATLESYLDEPPESRLTDELLACRRIIWDTLRNYSISLVKLNPAKYIHFGMQQEFFDLMVRRGDGHDFMDWQRQIKCNTTTDAVVINSMLHTGVAPPMNCYIEYSDVRDGCVIATNCILSGVSLENAVIPEKSALHCVKLKNGKYVCRILGLDDNPKNSVKDKYLAGSVESILTQAGLSVSDVCGDSATIWDAKLFAECQNAGSAADYALLLWKMSRGQASESEIARWKDAERHSFKSSFHEADVHAMLDWNENLEHRINVSSFVRDLSSGLPLLDALPALEYGGNSDVELSMLFAAAQNASFPLNMRLFHAVSVICRRFSRTIGGLDYEALDDMAYSAVRDVIVPEINDRHRFIPSGFTRDEMTIELPVRVNFCGSPSDAAPYCLEHGGTMFDGALLLKDGYPIKAMVKRLSEPVIILESIDLNARRSFTNLEEIRACGNPFDTFALHKAVLIAAGLIPTGDRAIEDVTERLGGGLYLSTFANVPKGSGLGTSSIVAAACIKALNAIFGQDVSDDRIYAQVFAAEQLMNTGGGWQDQAGALTPGLKLIQTSPGNYQNIAFQYVAHSIMEKLDDRFALIYSGQRRLARNVLREELNRCIENDPATMSAMDRIRSLCVLMKFELERGDITRFAGYVTEQFELVKTIDKCASNTYIEYIFEMCDDLIDGKAICGAGGGGFLQVILKEGVTKEMLKKRLDDVFTDCGVLLWECRLA